MKAFIWDQSFVTGLELVDEQHLFLVNLINRFGESLVESKSVDNAELAAVFGELAKYAQYHFSTEERLMQESGVAPGHQDPHRRQHADFISQVSSMWTARATLSNPAEVLHGFLCAWLAYHVLGEDQEMARQIAFIRAGKSPGEALQLAQLPRDNSTAGLLAALQNLYRVLTEQHQTLRQQNAELTLTGTVGVDRELAMIELKREVNALSRQLGRAAPYDVSFAGASPQDRP